MIIALMNAFFYFHSINEGESKFEPQLYVKANDLDESSILIFKIVDGNSEKLFALDRVTGEIKVRQRKGLRLDNILTDMIILTVEVTDSENKDTAKVEINVKDVNDRKPIFEKKEYLSSVPEIAPIGMYFLKLCPIFVGTILCQFSKYKKMLLVHSFLL